MRLLLCGTKLCVASLLGFLAMARAEVLRHDHLDYLDPQTLNEYLDTEQERPYDVAVMFYAQWCRNCHSFAPLWDQISRILPAGTSDSNLIMGLFDCEADYDHMEACTKAGVTHYPTLMFLSQSKQKLQSKNPTNAAIFPGNWQYGDAVLDWLKAMSALSSWHRAGWGKRLRDLLLGRRKSDSEKSLPIGVSQGHGSVTLQTALREAENQHTEAQELLLRSSNMIDTLLFPVRTTNSSELEFNGKLFADVFALIDPSWRSAAPMDQVIRTCVMELSLDYCGRLSSHIASEWIAAFKDVTQISEQDYKAYELNQAASIENAEPYCAVVEDCILSDFAGEHCRPSTCPFKDSVACRYMTTCLTPQLQEEYAIAMDLDLNDGNEDTRSIRSSAWGL